MLLQDKAKAGEREGEAEDEGDAGAGEDDAEEGSDAGDTEGGWRCAAWRQAAQAEQAGGEQCGGGRCTQAQEGVRANVGSGGAGDARDVDAGRAKPGVWADKVGRAEEGSAETGTGMRAEAGSVKVGDAGGGQREGRWVMQAGGSVKGEGQQEEAEGLDEAEEEVDPLEVWMQPAGWAEDNMEVEVERGGGGELNDVTRRLKAARMAERKDVGDTDEGDDVDEGDTESRDAAEEAGGRDAAEAGKVNAARGRRDAELGGEAEDEGDTEDEGKVGKDAGSRGEDSPGEIRAAGDLGARAWWATQPWPWPSASSREPSASPSCASTLPAFASPISVLPASASPSAAPLQCSVSPARVTSDLNRVHVARRVRLRRPHLAASPTSPRLVPVSTSLSPASPLRPRLQFARIA
ncbi:uncharacterized protein BXZ73DRAFT_82917 [Epithele typhae]|uniref:uncharacterized protein n=1 Tax=Epithele typhae TaxID=378194 RepID=UPI00200731B0|nr:uncharacterized protein BXZ73DRAFT_82917 [Epithele typhae]KAH9911234.1 hypothetical protein BXZ73DRAFT_82917 [Epithele typhae]